MAAPAVAVMLKAFAQLVAAETGRRISQEIAKKFIGLVFGHLATKDDIANAVKQINAFTAQKFDDLSREEILSPVMAAQTFLKDFELLTADEGYDQAAAYDVAFTAYETWVILPVLTGCDRRTHAAIFSFMAGVTPPMPIFGRSLL